MEQSLDLTEEAPPEDYSLLWTIVLSFGFLICCIGCVGSFFVCRACRIQRQLSRKLNDVKNGQKVVIDSMNIGPIEPIQAVPSQSMQSPASQSLSPSSIETRPDDNNDNDDDKKKSASFKRILSKSAKSKSVEEEAGRMNTSSMRSEFSGRDIQILSIILTQLNLYLECLVPLEA